MNLLKLILLLISLNAVNIQFAFSETPPINRQTPTSTPHESEALNADNIERWLQSQQAFEAWGEKHSETLESSSKQSTEPENPMEMTIDSLIEPLKSAGLYASANQVTSKYGFTNLESWANITLRITKAAAAIEFESHPEMMDSLIRKKIIVAQLRKYSKERFEKQEKNTKKRNYRCLVISFTTYHFLQVLQWQRQTTI